MLGRPSNRDACPSMTAIGGPCLAAVRRYWRREPRVGPEEGRISARPATSRERKSYEEGR
jgi:hypothetical protein